MDQSQLLVNSNCFSVELYMTATLESSNTWRVSITSMVPLSPVCKTTRNTNTAMVAVHVISLSDTFATHVYLFKNISTPGSHVSSNKCFSAQTPCYKRQCSIIKKDRKIHGMLKISFLCTFLTDVDT